jgi:hypothetical protein
VSGIDILIGGVLTGIGLLFFAILILVLIIHKFNKKRRQKAIVDRVQHKRGRESRKEPKYTEASLEVMEMKMKRDLQFSKQISPVLIHLVECVEFMLQHLLGIILLGGGIFLLVYPGIPENLHFIKYIVGSILVLIALIIFVYTCLQLNAKVNDIKNTNFSKGKTRSV